MTACTHMYVTKPLFHDANHGSNHMFHGVVQRSVEVPFLFSYCRSMPFSVRRL